MKKAFLILSLILISNLPSFAQTDSDTSSEEVVTIDTILADISDLMERIKINNKDKASKSQSRKLFIIKRNLDGAVKLTPPSKCHEKFKDAVYDFYTLVSKLSQGITCGPPIIPPFDLDPGSTKSLGPDCIPPSIGDGSVSTRIKVDIRSESYGIYEKLRQFYSNDVNGNEITDVCE